MQILTQVDLTNLKFKSSGAFRPKPEYEPIRKLEKGESILISREEWKPRSLPGTFFSPIAKREGKKFSTKTLLDNSGWVLTRIK